MPEMQEGQPETLTARLGALADRAEAYDKEHPQEGPTLTQHLGLMADQIERAEAPAEDPDARFRARVGDMSTGRAMLKFANDPEMMDFLRREMDKKKVPIADYQLPGGEWTAAPNALLGLPSFLGRTAAKTLSYGLQGLSALKQSVEAKTEVQKLKAENARLGFYEQAIGGPYETLHGMLGAPAKIGSALASPEYLEQQGGVGGLAKEIATHPMSEVVVPVVMPAVLPSAGRALARARGIPVEAPVSLWQKWEGRSLTPELLDARRSAEVIDANPDIEVGPRRLANDALSVIADPDATPSTRRFMVRQLKNIADGKELEYSLAKRISDAAGETAKRVWGEKPLQGEPTGPVPGDKAQVLYQNVVEKIANAQDFGQLSEVWNMAKTLEKMGLDDGKYAPAGTFGNVYLKAVDRLQKEAPKTPESPSIGPEIPPSTPRSEPPGPRTPPGPAQPTPGPEVTPAATGTQAGGIPEPIPTPEAAPVLAPEAPAVTEATRSAVPDRVAEARLAGERISYQKRESLSAPGEAKVNVTREELVNKLAEAVKLDPKIMETLKVEDPKWAEDVQKVIDGQPMTGVGAAAANDIAFVQKIAGMNMRRINIQPAAAAYLQKMAEAYPEKFAPEPMSLPETDAMAVKLIRDQKFTIEDLMKIPESQKYTNPAKGVAARKILGAVVDQAELKTRELQDAYASGRLTKEAYTAAINETLVRAVAVSSKVKGLMNEYGRALSAQRLMADAVAAGEQAAKFLDDILEKERKEAGSSLPGFKPEAKGWFADAFAKTKAWIAKAQDFRLVRMLVELSTVAKLTHPLTHAVNFVSNQINLLGLKPLTDLTRALTTKEGRIGEVSADYAGMVGGLKEANGAFWSTLKTGEYPWAEGMRFDEGVPGGGAVKTEIPGKVGQYISKIFTLLKASDAWSQSLVQAAEWRAQAYRQAAKEGLTGAARVQRAAELVKQADFLISHLSDVRKVSEYYTGNTTLGQLRGHLVKDKLTGKMVEETQLTDIPRLLDSMAKKCIEIKRENPVLGFPFPFVKTCANFARMSIEYSPLNIPNLIRKAVNGEMKGLELADARAKAIIGTIVGISVYEMAMNDMITGGPPSDPAERRRREAAGERWNCVKLGGVYVPYSPYLPLGMMCGMAADLAEMTKHNRDPKNIDPEKQRGLTATMVLAVRHNIGDQTFMMGLQELTKAYQDPEQQGNRVLISLLTGSIPSVLGATARAVDTEKHAPKTTLEAIQARIPWWSKELPPLRDRWGNAMEYPGGSVGAFIGASRTPSYVKTDELDEECERLGISASPPSNKIGIKGKKYTMDPLEYDFYQEEAGGQAYEKAMRVLARPMSDEKKTAALKQAIEKPREEWLTKFKKREWPRLVQEAK